MLIVGHAQSTLQQIRPSSNDSRASRRADDNRQQDRNAIPRGSNGNNFGYETVSLAFHNSFCGRIARFVESWSIITKDPWIQQTVSRGFCLNLTSEPVQYFIPRNAPMINTQLDLCDGEVRSLLEKGAVVRAHGEGFLSGIFLIPKKSGGFRPIINFKGLNSFITYRHFKMEGIQTIRKKIRNGDCLAKIDLKDAYLSVPMREDCRRFLRFQWKGVIYEFVCLPFGLPSAPWAFTKLLRPVVAHLRRMGIRVVIYLDDILIVQASKEATSQAVKIVTRLLESLGFVISEEKSEEDPTQKIEYIGLTISSIPMTLSLPDKKVTEMKNGCRLVLRKDVLSLRDMASMLGNFNWASAAVNFAQSLYRGFQALYLSNFKSASGDLHRRVKLNSESRADLIWWASKADSSAGRAIQMESPTVSICSDASLSGWGAVCRVVRTGGPWTMDESHCHINKLELLAALKALQGFTSATSNTSVEIKIDNTTAVSYINKLGDTRSQALCAVALGISGRKDVNQNTLFLSTTKPFQPVSSSTIGRGIKDQLKSAGVDTNIYTAHSTR
jgi:hypothetical protein